MIYGMPDPLYPADTQDQMLSIEIDTRYGMDSMAAAQFRCATCGQSYWRYVEAEMLYTEVVEVDGVVDSNGNPAHYVLNPEAHYVYGPIQHVCLDKIRAW